MHEISLTSKEHHKRGPDGSALCGAPLQGFVALYTDDHMVTCPKCLEKIEEEKNE